MAGVTLIVACLGMLSPGKTQSCLQPPLQSLVIFSVNSFDSFVCLSECFTRSLTCLPASPDTFPTASIDIRRVLTGLASRGALMTATIVIFIAAGSVAGFVAGRLHRTVGGTEWRAGVCHSPHSFHSLSLSLSLSPTHSHSLTHSLFHSLLLTIAFTLPHHISPNPPCFSEPWP